MDTYTVLLVDDEEEVLMAIRKKRAVSETQY